MRVYLLCVAALVLAGVALTPASAAAGGGWLRPVDGPVLRAFALGPDRFAAGQHRGVDLGAPPGAGVRAACGGRVTFAGGVPRGGRTVSVRCGRLVATYQHLGAVVVRRGRIVSPGARIGTVGHPRPRAHVHLGARVAATGRYVDPLALLGDGVGRVPPPLVGARRPRPLGPAPRARRIPAAQRVRVPVVAGRRAPAAASAELPWLVWLGLACVGLGLPLGGVVRVRARRRRLVAALARAAS